MSKANVLASLATDVNELSSLADQISEIEGAIEQANTNFHAIQSLPEIPEIPEIPPPVLSFRNKIINGNFDVWQRGTSFTISNSTNSYSADRWRFVGNNFTGTLTRENFNPGQTDVPYNPDYFAKWTVTTNPAANITFAQYIENVRTLAGKTATFSLYLKSSSTIAADSLNIRYRHTTGSVTNVSTGIGEITTSWRKFTCQLNIPSLLGETLGESNDSYLAIEIVSPTAHISAFDLSIAQVQLEEGEVDTPFEQRPYGLELSLCQRYYQQMLLSCLSIDYNRRAHIFHNLIPNMRKKPTAKVYSGQTETLNKVSGYSSAIEYTIERIHFFQSSVGGTEEGVPVVMSYVECPSGSSFPAQPLWGKFTFDAEL